MSEYKPNESNYDSSDPVIIEDEGMSSASIGLSIKQIALEQFRRCGIELTKPMSQGGYEQKFINGNPIVVQVPNQREVFKNSVLTLETTLYPSIMSKEEFKDKIKSNDKEIENENKLFNDKRNNIIKNSYNNHNLKLLKQYSMQPQKNNNIDYEKLLLNLIDEHEIILVSIYQRRLRILSLLLNELKYFDESGMSA